VVSRPYEGMFEEPIVKYVRNLILEAFRESVTHIVLHQYQRSVTVRYRRDDEVLYVPSPPRKAQVALFDCLKGMAGLSSEGERGREDGEISYTRGSEVLQLPVTLRRAPAGETIVISLSRGNSDGVIAD